MLGVIVTLALTTLWNYVFPSNPTIVKEVTDSIKVIHNHNFGDSTLISKQLQNQLENLKILNEYETEIDKRIKRISKSSTNINSNKILTSTSFKLKGWMQRNGSNFFYLNCPNSLEAKILEFHLNFFNSTITKDIEVLRVLVYRKNVDGENYIYSDTFYEVNTTTPNVIQMGNSFESGTYTIQVGFFTKENIKEKYPEFINLKCKFKKE